MKTKRVLVIDDEANVTHLVKLALERTGFYTVREENSSTQAVNTAREFKPDVILLDVIMPNIDGGALAVSFDADPYLKTVPKIFITGAVSRKEAKEEGLQSGGFVFLAKPINLQNLLHCLEGVLGKPAGPAKDPAASAGRRV